MLLIAGGTGITPMIQIIREILDNEDDYVKVNLWYSVHSAEELILKEEFDEWKSYWNFNVKYFFTDEVRFIFCVCVSSLKYTQNHNFELNRRKKIVFKSLLQVKGERKDSFINVKSFCISRS